MKFSTGPKASVDPLLRVLLNRAMKLHTGGPPRPPKIDFTAPHLGMPKGSSFKVNAPKPIAVSKGDQNEPFEGGI